MLKNNRPKYKVDDHFIHKATGNIWKITKVFQSEYISKPAEYRLECVKDKHNCIDYPYIPAMESNLNEFYELSPSAKILYKDTKLKQQTIGLMDYHFGDMYYSTVDTKDILTEMAKILHKK